MGSLSAPPNDLPPPDSLLFSPNPQAITQDFQPSPYQTEQIGGPWGNGQWGDPWVGNIIPPAPSPIFTLDTDTKAALLDQLDLDNDYLRYAEEDLLGAVYHYDDDPFAPTAQLVAESALIIEQIGNMGVSD